MDVDQAASAHRQALARVGTVKATYAQQLREARQSVDAARAALAQAIIEAYRDGARVGELAQRSRYSRETVRVILRTAGVEPD